MPQPRDAAYLADILRAAEMIVVFLEGIDHGTFLLDLKTQSAAIRQFEVIGEATKRISAEFKAGHPAVPWKKMGGMRDIPSLIATLCQIEAGKGLSS